MLPETTCYIQENRITICDCIHGVYSTQSSKFNHELSKWWCPVFIHGVYPFIQQVAYPDLGPVMLLSESSVKDLSSKLETDVTVERFRPNIVISDCEAFDEVRCSAFACTKHICKCCSDFFSLLVPLFGYKKF